MQSYTCFYFKLPKAGVGGGVGGGVNERAIKKYNKREPEEMVPAYQARTQKEATDR